MRYALLMCVIVAVSLHMLPHAVLSVVHVSGEKECKKYILEHIFKIYIHSIYELHPSLIIRLSPLYFSSTA